MVSTSAASARSIANQDEILNAYFVRETAAKIREAKFNRVALQFPDYLLKFAPYVYSALCEYLAPDILIFILGDTSYGACCVDEVNAQHLDAQAIVHYGQSCLSPTRTLPVLHVFPNRRKVFNDKDRMEIFDSISTIFCSEPIASRVLIMYDIPLTEPVASLEIDDCFTDDDKIVEVALPTYSTLSDFVQPDAKFVGSRVTCTTENCGALQFSSITPINDTVILWISENQDVESDFSSPAMRNAALQFANGMSNSCQKMFSLVLRRNLEQVDACRLFRRRAGTLSRVVQAQRIGVVAGTLAISGANEAIEDAVRIVEQAGKHAYIILVGKPTPPKLLNFEEIEAFVFVSCPFRALFSSKEVPVPVLTPFELKLALCNRDEVYEKPYKVGFVNSSKLEEENATSSADNNVSVRSGLDVSVNNGSSASSFYKSRIWKGLTERRGGQSDSIPVEALSSEIQEGSSGLPLRYTTEMN